MGVGPDVGAAGGRADGEVLIEPDREPGAKAALGRGAELTVDEVVTYVFGVLDVAALAVP
jgi:hypothetical protein